MFRKRRKLEATIVLLNKRIKELEEENEKWNWHSYYRQAVEEMRKSKKIEKFLSAYRYVIFVGNGGINLFDNGEWYEEFRGLEFNYDGSRPDLMIKK